MIERNPGVALVWTSRTFRPFTVAARPELGAQAGVLFDVGEPEAMRWYARGRDATAREIITSITSGLPALREVAELEGPAAVAELEAKAAAVLDQLSAMA